MPTPTTYTYSIASDFPGGKVNTTNFVSEIRASSIVTALTGINTDGDVLSIFFKDVLSAADKTTLDGDTTGPAGGLIAATNNTTTLFAATSVTLQANVSSDGTLNGTTPVTLVPAPNNNVIRAVKTININNTDTAAVFCIIQFKNVSTTRTIWRGTLQPGDTWQYGEAGDLFVLDSPNKSIIASLSAPPTTLNPDFTCCYGDAN